MGIAHINHERANQLRFRRMCRAVHYLTKLDGRPAKTLWIAEAIGANEAYTRQMLKGCSKFKQAGRGEWILV